MTIRKAVIPAAGLGTRFLPATKAMPKEMLPIVDKPAIQYIVEEAVHSGIENILIVTGRNKKAIEDHFDTSVELEQVLTEKGKLEMLETVRSISGLANIYYIRQKEPLGLGHAILCARHFVGDDPFAVLLGDDMMTGEPPALKRMLDLYETEGKSVIGVQTVSPSEVDKYGIVSPGKLLRDGIREALDLVEKPKPQEAPSAIAVMGRYVLGPSIFPALMAIERGAGNEYQLTDALRLICRQEGLLAMELPGSRYDIGDKFGYLRATIEMGLMREELRPRLIAYLQDIVEANREPGRKNLLSIF